jgi:hypothetical protein
MNVLGVVGSKIMTLLTGCIVGYSVGNKVGFLVGYNVGSIVFVVGFGVGFRVGLLVGNLVGERVGVAIIISIGGPNTTSVAVASAIVFTQRSPQYLILALRLLVKDPLLTCLIIYSVIVV